MPGSHQLWFTSQNGDQVLGSLAGEALLESDEVTPSVWIGRQLNSAEARQAIELGVTAVLDLSSEFSEAAPLVQVNYYHLPILDLTAPTQAQLQAAARFIDENSQAGIVYVQRDITELKNLETEVTRCRGMLAAGGVEATPETRSFIPSAQALPGQTLPSRKPTKNVILWAEDNDDDVTLMARAWQKAQVDDQLIRVPTGSEVIEYLSGAGRYADRALMPMLYLSLGALAVVLALFTLTAHNKIAAAVTIALIGALGFATVPPLQKRVLDQAHGAPTLASALNIGAFNLGNALSAWLGGLVIGAGLGYTAPNWVGAVLAASALVLAFVSAALERRDTRPGTVLAGPVPTERRTAVPH